MRLAAGCMDPLGELTALPRSIAGFEGVGPRKREGLGGSVEGVCGEHCVSTIQGKCARSDHQRDTGHSVHKLQEYRPYAAYS